VVPADATDHGDLHDQSIAQLLKQLAHETSTLVRQELELVKAEMREKGKKAGPGLGMIGGAGIVALLAAGSLTAFLILALDGVMPNWAAALIVTAVYTAAAAVLYLRGKERVSGRVTRAAQTIETLKEDVEWAKHPTRSVTR
jgi:uncharacterized membrane protein YqjE